jgi:hypothetical protein
MLPVFDTSPSREYPEPYRLLAPLVVLAYPSGMALPQLRTDVPMHSRHELDDDRPVGHGAALDPAQSLPQRNFTPTRSIRPA